MLQVNTTATKKSKYRISNGNKIDKETNTKQNNNNKKKTEENIVAKA